MAIWQYDLIIRRKDQKYWTIEDVEDEVFKLKDELQESESWTNKIRIFGEEDSTCILVFNDNGEVNEIEVRLDLRSLTTNTLNQVMSCIDALNPCILTDTGDLIEFNTQWILESIQNSNALKVVKNPADYFGKLK